MKRKRPPKLSLHCYSPLTKHQRKKAKATQFGLYKNKKFGKFQSQIVELKKVMSEMIEKGEVFSPPKRLCFNDLEVTKKIKAIRNRFESTDDNKNLTIIQE